MLISTAAMYVRCWVPITLNYVLFKTGTILCCYHHYKTTIISIIAIGYRVTIGSSAVGTAN